MHCPRDARSRQPDGDAPLEANSEDHMGLTIDDRVNYHGEFLGVVFQIGILNDADIV